jgi:serine/threonine-protein kinase
MRFAKRTLGKYRIQKRLAEGGFAEVYRALDTIEGIPVALKIPHDHMVTEELLADFKREVRLMARLDHPNILTVKNAELLDGHFAVVYPLGKGTLSERLERRLSADARVDLAEQMLSAVAYAHASRVIHCDLKPDNMILFPAPPGSARASGLRLRLTDFGLAKLSARTVVASGSGTVGYVSPEQALGHASFRSDVFSLGLVLWELFSGELPTWPFEWPPPGTERLRRRVHPDFLALLRRAIRVRESLRFAGAEAMLAAFLRLKRAGKLLRPKGRHSRPVSRGAADWRELRQRQFERTYRKELDLTHRCGRCGGAMSEAMRACPWCAHAPARFRGETRYPARCPRCRRGRKRDWRYCPYCYGPRLRQVDQRRYGDPRYRERCRAAGCGRRELFPFMRYCPWCRAKTRQRWRIAHATQRCTGCAWPVLPDYWKVCPWCARRLAARWPPASSSRAPRRARLRRRARAG